MKLEEVFAALGDYMAAMKRRSGRIEARKRLLHTIKTAVRKAK